MAGKALSGIKVVEYGEFITAPFCSKVLADMGADVIKIEKPRTGDKSRRHGPFPGDIADPEKSGLFLSLNANKRGITLDPTQPPGRKILKELLKDADIFVENNAPNKMKGIGLDYASLKGDFPGLVMTSLTPWGQTGPYRDFKGYCLNYSGMTGFATMLGNPNREPLDHPMNYLDYRTGHAGATASLIALFYRNKTGKGQQCDVAGFQNNVAYDGTATVMYYQGQGDPALSLRSGNHSVTVFYPAMILPCKDGYFAMYTLDFLHWKKFMKALGDPEWSKDPRFNPDPAMGVYVLTQFIDELDALLTNTLANFTKQELFDACRENKVPFLPVMNMEDMVNNPQTQFRHEIVELNHPFAGVQKYPGAPAIMSGTPWKLETPAPLLGQHNEEIFCKKLGYSKEDLLEYERAGII